MNTTYETIYHRFLSKIVDFDLPHMTDEELKRYCNQLMKAAIPKIRPLKNSLEDRDDIKCEFTNELLDIEVEMIACQMTAEWITPKLYNTQLTVMFLGTKDEKFNSQANLIAALRTLRDDMIATVNTLRRDYQYQHSEYMQSS